MSNHPAFKVMHLMTRDSNSSLSSNTTGGFNSSLDLNSTLDGIQHCNTTTCDYASSYYPYPINLAATLTFLALFGGAHISFIVTYLMMRNELAFNAIMAAGTLFETVGSSGRLISWFDQWQLPPYLLQLCCLTIGPVFVNAAIYVSMRRLAAVYGEQNWPTDLRTLLQIVRLSFPSPTLAN